MSDSENWVKPVVLMISAPGDLNEKVESRIQKAVRVWNYQRGLKKRVIFIPVIWRENVSSAYSAYEFTQGIVDDQITSNADALLAIFRDSLGSPLPAEDKDKGKDKDEDKDERKGGEEEKRENYTGTTWEIYQLQKKYGTEENNCRIGVFLDNTKRQVPRDVVNTTNLLKLNEYISDKKNSFFFNKFNSADECQVRVIVWLDRCSDYFAPGEEYFDQNAPNEECSDQKTNTDESMENKEGENDSEMNQGLLFDKKTTREKVIELIGLIHDGKVTTYGDIASVVRSNPRAVARILLSRDIPATQAGVVVHGSSSDDFLYENDDFFINNNDETANLSKRSSVLLARGVPFVFESDKRTILISKDKKDGVYLDKDALRNLVIEKERKEADSSVK